MDTDAPQQTPLRKNKLHRVLIGMVVLLTVFIVVCVGLLAFVAVSHHPTQPRPRVLKGTDGQTVLAGTTRGDIEQAVRLARESGVEMFKDNPDAVRQKVDQMGQLMLAGRLIEFDNGTNCLLLASSGSLCQVQITDGPRNGQTVWVPRQYVSRVYAGGEPTMGFCCVSSYLRYLITAAVCCVVLYLLKLKSVLFQIILFVVGMVILNVLWVKIAVLLMF